VHIKEDAVFAPVAMWLEATDLVLQRLKENGTPFHRIKGISGAGQQHGSVYWAKAGEEILANLNPEQRLVDQLSPAGFSHAFSPNWQDHSTQTECDAFDAEFGSIEKLAQITGSKAHHVSCVHSINLGEWYKI
jgi:xylulokinase